MNRPNLPAILADALENSAPGTWAALVVGTCLIGTWLYTGSLLTAIGFTVLASIPASFLVAAGLLVLWVALRLLDGGLRLTQPALRRWACSTRRSISRSHTPTQNQ